MEQTLKRIEEYYTDEFNLPVHHMPNEPFTDGGDTCQRLNMLDFGLKVLGYPKDYIGRPLESGYREAVSQLRYATGVFVRHPNPERWWSRPKEFSRDQQSALVIALGEFGRNEDLKQVFAAHVQRFGFYQNSKAQEKTKIPDFAMPQHWGLYIRAFNSKLFAPLLYLTDVGLIVDSLIFTIRSYYNQDDTSDDLNHIMALVQARRRLPTPLSWLARKIYSIFRKNAGPKDGNRLEGYGPQTALDHYFRPEQGGLPINEIYKPIVELYIRN